MIRGGNHRDEFSIAPLLPCGILAVRKNNPEGATAADTDRREYLRLELGIPGERNSFLCLALIQNLPDRLAPLGDSVGAVEMVVND